MVCIACHNLQSFSRFHSWRCNLQLAMAENQLWKKKSPLFQSVCPYVLLIVMEIGKFPLNFNGIPNVIKLMLFMGQRCMSLCCCLYYLHQEHVTWIFVWSYMCCLLDLECHSYNIITNNMIRQLNLCWISCDGVLASVEIFKKNSESKRSCSSSPTKFALK